MFGQDARKGFLIVQLERIQHMDKICTFGIVDL